MKAWRNKPAMGRAAHRSRVRRWLNQCAKVIATALNCPDRPWFSLTARGIR